MNDFFNDVDTRFTFIVATALVLTILIVFGTSSLYYSHKMTRCTEMMKQYDSSFPIEFKETILAICK